MAMFEWSGLRRALSALFAALMPSLSLAPLAATMGRDQGRQRKYRRRTPEAGGPAVSSKFTCRGGCG